MIEREHAVWMGDHLVSSKNGHYLHGCPFLAWEGDFSLCTIYSTRPAICRHYRPGSSEICSRFEHEQPADVPKKQVEPERRPS